MQASRVAIVVFNKMVDPGIGDFNYRGFPKQTTNSAHKHGIKRYRPPPAQAHAQPAQAQAQAQERPPPLDPPPPELR